MTNSVYSYQHIASREVCYLKLQNLLESAINAQISQTIQPIKISIQSNPLVVDYSFDFTLVLMSRSGNNNGSFEILFIGLIFMFFSSTLLLKEKKGQMLQYLRSFGLYVID